MASPDRLLGFVLLMASAITLAGARGLGLIQRGAGFGPGMFPVIIGLGLLLCSLLLLLNPESSAPARATQLGQGSPRRALGSWAVTAAFLVVVGHAGFLVASMLLAAASTRLFGERRWWVCLLYGAAVGTLANLLFTRWLNVPLPAGILG